MKSGLLPNFPSLVRGRTHFVGGQASPGPKGSFAHGARGAPPWPRQARRAGRRAPRGVRQWRCGASATIWATMHQRLPCLRILQTPRVPRGTSRKSTSIKRFDFHPEKPRVKPNTRTLGHLGLTPSRGTPQKPVSLGLDAPGTPAGEGAPFGLSIENLTNLASGPVSTDHDSSAPRN